MPPQVITHSQLRTDMACYDELDPDIRTLIQHMPVSSHFCLQLLQMQRSQGKTAVMEFIKTKLELHFPKYKPI